MRRKEPVLTGLEEFADFQIIRDWEKSTETGDRSEIKTLPELSAAWNKIDARRDLCLRPEVPAVRKVLYHADASAGVRERHHHREPSPVLRGSAVKGEEYGGIIPEYAAVVFDEAHEIEDVAGQYFGKSISNTRFRI